MTINRAVVLRATGLPCGSNTFGAVLRDAGDLTGATVTTDDRSCGGYVGGSNYVAVSRASAGTCLHWPSTW